MPLTCMELTCDSTVLGSMGENNWEHSCHAPTVHYDYRESLSSFLLIGGDRPLDSAATEIIIVTIAVSLSISFLFKLFPF